ncbi:MAG: primosomal protein N' [Epulopiscium sp.]|nr:primosomal protein N' [Candidatus Epulonipiscium sp.]
MNQNLYAEVIVDIAHEKVDRIFHYSIPYRFQSFVQIGMRVLVPFGTANRKMEGYILGFTEESNIPSEKIKNILQVIDDTPILNQEMIDLAKWMKKKYQCTLLECLRCLLPTGMRVKSHWVVELSSKTSLNEDMSHFSSKAKAILRYIYDRGAPVPLKELEDTFGSNITNTLYSLRKNKILIQKSVPKIKDLRKKIKIVSLLSLERAEEVYQECKKKKYYAQERILDFLIQNHQAPLNELKQILQVSDSSFRSLEQKKAIFIKETEVRRTPYLGGPKANEQHFIPTQEQQNVIQYIKKQMENSRGQTVLLHGVTGSGKTEVYLKLIQQILKQGKQAIVLVPEISLTPQMTQRFIQRFGEQVAFTHSKLSVGERYDQWRRAKEGEVSIMVGPRSAVFTPFPSIGLIILDEEHEMTYKSEMIPKYHAREIAQKRCQMSKGLILLGSATPSIETYYLAQKGDYHFVSMKNRATKHSLPTVHIVDMREELANGNRSMFSKDLYEGIKQNLENKEQTLLFLNRRGHSTFISCRSCGFVLKCSKCNIPYTYHSCGSLLRCHYCGEQIKNPRICPQCGSNYIRFFGVGTQKIEEETRKLFPYAKILRMDLDTTSGKHGHTQILEQFYNGQGDILIGTQMIAKGHDFPNVTLVGVLAADTTLYMEDFRSSERTFQLLTQVSGRAGRGEKKGRVYIQTYTPEHYSIQTAKEQDYPKFYEQELIFRFEMKYPPYSHIYSILLTGNNEKSVIQNSFRLTDFFHLCDSKKQFQIIGPSPAMLSKINNEYRWRLMIKHENQALLAQYAHHCITKYLQTENLQDIQVYKDLNPLVMY